MLHSKFSFNDESYKSDVKDKDKYNNKTGIITSSDLMKKRDGLRNGLAPKKNTQDAPIGSPEVEGFLKEVEKQLITIVAEED